MSEARSYAGEKESGGCGAYGEECQCDSGVGGLRSLPGQLGEGEPRSPAAHGAPSDEGSDPPGVGKAAADAALEVDERLDSSYGSSSLVESLPRLEEPPRAEEEEDQLRQQQQPPQETFTFISEDGDTLLHLAIIHCMPSLALSCITQSPVEVLELQNDLFQTPLHLSVYLEQHTVVEALVLQGVKRALQDRNGNTPLHLACEQQSLECAQLLLQEPVPGKSFGVRRTQQDLQLQNWQGLTCLHISTLKGNLQLMALLVKNGADINVQDGTSGKTSLHLAVENHDEMAVRLLLRMGAQVDAQMFNGCTPLHLAVGRKDAVIAAILCHSGADTLLRNMEDETAQDLADGNDDILTVLPFDDLKISGKPVVCSS
ncbi:NF-kappa-B inhibitor epsilon [Tiliqua scincoides]|uniref:NF-kappa-B inhibitor epsilon n=1 Tax=Tiliqua scincoides TaxID=71010 RepID=UPI003462A998